MEVGVVVEVVVVVVMVMVVGLPAVSLVPALGSKEDVLPHS